MNLIFLSLVSQSQATEDLRLATEVVGSVGSEIKKWWKRCTRKVAPEDGKMCFCFMHEECIEHQHGVCEMPKHCTSKQICRDGQCVESKTNPPTVRKKCTSLDRCERGQGQCSGNHDCWGDLICGEQSCGTVRKTLEGGEKTFREMFEQGYVAGVTDPTMTHENNHCCCDQQNDKGCTERHIPFMKGADCSVARECHAPYTCTKSFKGLFYRCELDEVTEKAFNELTREDKKSWFSMWGFDIAEGQIEGQAVEIHEHVDLTKIPI